MPAKTYPFTLFMYEGIYRIIGAFYFNLRQIIFHVNLAHRFFRIIKGVLPTYNEQDCDYLVITHSSFFFSSTQNCFSNLPITKFTGFFCIHSNKKVPSDTLMLSKGTMYFHSPRFHPFCFFKPLHLTITESPGRIGAAQSWSSITFLLKPLHHKTGFLSVTFTVIYSSLLRFVFLCSVLFGSR